MLVIVHWKSRIHEKRWDILWKKKWKETRKQLTSFIKFHLRFFEILCRCIIFHKLFYFQTFTKINVFCLETTKEKTHNLFILLLFLLESEKIPFSYPPKLKFKPNNNTFANVSVVVWIACTASIVNASSSFTCSWRSRWSATRMGKIADGKNYSKVCTTNRFVLSDL